MSMFFIQTIKYFYYEPMQIKFALPIYLNSNNMIIKKLSFAFTCLVATIANAATIEKNQVIYLNQAWTPEQRAQFYWTSQGSALMSYDIYLNLAAAGSNDLFNSTKHINTLGLLTEPPNLTANPDNLPVGITKTVVNKGQFKGNYVGVTCAACHTGQVQYQGKQIRIDGGAGTRFNISAWITSLSNSLDETLNNPLRFQQMIARMKQRGPVDQDEVKAQLAKDAAYVRDEVSRAFISPFPPGPGRVDALGKIHNSFESIAPKIDTNERPLTAPVKPPFIWHASNSSWVQWTGVSDDPFRRNYVEAVGVFSRYNLTSHSVKDGLFESTVNAKGLIQIEQLLRQLAPPQWPESIFGKLDQKKVASGKQLYKENCIECHTTYPFRWSEPRLQGKRFIEHSIVPLSIIGTDPEQFNGITFDAKRTMLTTHLSPFFNGKTVVTEGEFRETLLPKMMALSLAKAGPISPQEMIDLKGYTGLPGDPPRIQTDSGIKAAAREGTWAIAPYLHNSSVPNLYELLSPAHERPKTFRVTREFDPKNLGISSKGAASDYLFDTTLIGNSNAGLSFEDGTGVGIIGRKLSSKERYEIIEYIKSLPNSPGQVAPYGEPPANAMNAMRDATWFGYKHKSGSQSGK